MASRTPPSELAAWLARQRWFPDRTRRPPVEIDDEIAVGATGVLWVLRVAGEAHYLVAPPLGDRDDMLADLGPGLVALIGAGGHARGLRGTLLGLPSAAFPRGLGGAPAVRRLGAEQSNTSVVVHDRLVLKCFRRLLPGAHPDLEMTRFLTEHTAFPATPRLAGSVEYRRDDGTVYAVAVAQERVTDGRDGWDWMLERLRAGDGALPALGGLAGRLAELHAALATPTDNPAFAPEPITDADTARWAAAVQQQAQAARAVVADRGLPAVPPVDEALAGLRGRTRQRHHGDFHLGQTLRREAADDWAIIDFEGEPLRPLEERRRKHTVLRDVAGLLRSLSYAAVSAPARDPDWERQARAAVLDTYIARTADAPFVPRRRAELLRALAVFELEKAAYEIVYESRHRPDWVGIPVAGFVSASAALSPRAGAA